MRQLVNLGPFTCRKGRWTPRGVQRGKFRFRNSWNVVRGSVLSARIFVGLYVDGKPKWTQGQVVAYVKKIWRHEASFIAQDGLWTDRGVLKPEKSTQVVLLNIDADGGKIHQTRASFEAAVGKLAQGLQKVFKQKLVVVDIQSNGRTVGTGFAT